MLSGAVSGGVRWKKADRIEASWTDLVKEAGSTIANIVVWDAGGTALAKYRSDKWEPVDLAGLRGKWSARLDAGKMAIMVHENYLVVAAPVTTGAEKTRIGTLAIAWSLDTLNEKVSSAIATQAFMGAVVVISPLAAPLPS